MDLGKRYSVVLFCVYLTFLTFCILFKGSLTYLQICMRAYENGEILQKLTNLHLFKNIGTTLSHWKNPWLMMNVLVNIALFLPLGIFFGRKLENKSRSGIIVAGAVGGGLSLCYELIQHVTGFGSFDVDDIVLNGTGALAGYGLLVFYRSYHKTSLPAWLRYVLIQVMINMTYLLCSTSFYYIFHMNNWISKMAGLLLAMAAGGGTMVQSAYTPDRKRLCLLFAGKCLQIFLMDWILVHWIPNGFGGLVLALLLWGLVLYVWYYIDNMVKRF